MSKPKYSVHVVSPAPARDERKAALSGNAETVEAYHRKRRAMERCITLLKAAEQLCRRDPEASAEWLTKCFESAPAVDL